MPLDTSNQLMPSKQPSQSSNVRHPAYMVEMCAWQNGRAGHDVTSDALLAMAVYVRSQSSSTLGVHVISSSDHAFLLQSQALLIWLLLTMI